MEVKDLMIGDWVSYRGIFNRIAPADFNSYHKIWMEEIEPIPLTPEILEKNGFIYTDPHLSTLSEDKVWQIENTDMQVLIELEAQTDENLIEYYIGNFLCGANSCTLYFTYVHQLQQALRLCGIDKEIVL